RDWSSDVCSSDLGNTFTYIAHKPDNRELLHPVVVVNQYRSIFFLSIKVKKTGKHSFNSFHIFVQRFLIKQVSFVTLTRRVTYHTCSTPHKRNRLVPAFVQVYQYNNRH